jgi:hypothetical protein
MRIESGSFVILYCLFTEIFKLESEIKKNMRTRHDLNEKEPSSLQIRNLKKENIYNQQRDNEICCKCNENGIICKTETCICKENNKECTEKCHPYPLVFARCVNKVNKLIKREKI